MSRVLLVQWNRAMVCFHTTSRKHLSHTDLSRAEYYAKECPAMETGYYDVLLLPRKVSAETFNNWAAETPKAVYNGALDAVIGVLR